MATHRRALEGGGEGASGNYVGGSHVVDGTVLAWHAAASRAVPRPTDADPEFELSIIGIRTSSRTSYQPGLAADINARTRTGGEASLRRAPCSPCEKGVANRGRSPGGGEGGGGEGGSGDESSAGDANTRWRQRSRRRQRRLRSCRASARSSAHVSRPSSRRRWRRSRRSSWTAAPDL